MHVINFWCLVTPFGNISSFCEVTLFSRSTCLLKWFGSTQVLILMLFNAMIACDNFSLVGLFFLSLFSSRSLLSVSIYVIDLSFLTVFNLYHFFQNLSVIHSLLSILFDSVSIIWGHLSCSPQFVSYCVTSQFSHFEQAKAWPANY